MFNIYINRRYVAPWMGGVLTVVGGKFQGKRLNSNFDYTPKATMNRLTRKPILSETKQSAKGLYC